LKTNVIYNEDCLEGMKRLPDGSIDLVLTDPPYKVTSRGNAGNSGGMLQKDINKKGQVFKNNDIEIENYLPIFYDKLKEKSHCYIMTNHTNLVHFLKVIDNSEFHFIKSLVWDKGNKIMGQYYMSQFEYILFLRKGAGKMINNCGTSDILSVPNKKTKDKNGDNIHDTEKPVKLMQVLIENSSQSGDIILDPFIGSGTTAVAALKTKRKIIGYELEEKYYNMAIKRMGKFNKKYYDMFPKEEQPAQLQMF